MSTEKPKPTYWGRIPAEVRYDKQLPPAARLLYAEFDALCRKEGRCWASNSYFARLFEVDTATISRWIKKLADHDHITTKIVSADGNKRYIYLLTKKSVALLTEKSRGIDKNAQTPIDEKVNPSINNTSVNRGGEKETPSVKGSFEDVSNKSYRQALDECRAMSIEFHEFFSSRVLGRFNKYSVTATILEDWYEQLWQVHGPEVLEDAIKQYRNDNTGWQISWAKLVKLVKEISQKKQQSDILAAEHDQRLSDAEKIHTGEFYSEWLDLAEADPAEFIEKYNAGGFFTVTVDSKPRLKEAYEKAKLKVTKEVVA